MNTLPRSLTPELQRFCASISSNRPVFVKSKPHSDAKVSHCFENVRQKIDRAGGNVVYGWSIWHVCGLYFEAEHQGVWENRQGRLLDVTPQLNNYVKIVFLPDPDAIYDPQNYRSNLIVAVDESPLAQEFATLANERNRIRDAYRYDVTSYAVISNDDNYQLKVIENRLQDIWKINNL